MKHYLLAITLDRPDFTLQTWANNFDPANWGRPADGVRIMWVDNGSTADNYARFFSEMTQYKPAYHELLTENRGIAYAVNRMMRVAFEECGADMVTTIGSDIIEPDGWLGLRERAMQTIPNSMLCSIKVSDAATLPIVKERDGITYEVGSLISGNHTISRKCWERFGYYYEPMGIYGPIDFEYCLRIRYHVGPISYQIANARALHLGGRGMNPAAYQARKDESDKAAWPLYHERIRSLRADNLHYRPDWV